MELLRVSRRELVLAGISGAGALAIGVYGGFRLGRRDERRRRSRPPRDQAFAPNAFVAIDEQGQVTIWLGQAELGQGVATALPMVVADELGADPARIRVVLAPADEAYGAQFTAVSSSVREHFLMLRRAGAAAREMLVAAAAAGFGVPAATCAATGGAVVHRDSGRRLPFGALARAAARLPVPADPRLRDPAEFEFIGKGMRRLDHPAKVDGSARYGADVRLPGLLFAVVARCPVVGGRVATFDGARARAVPGVHDVFAIESGVVVAAATTHAALRGRDALDVQFDPGPHASWSSEQVAAVLRTCLESPGATARRVGRGRAGLDEPGRQVAAEYELPYLAHAPMETMNCTADVRPDGAEIHVPTQVPRQVRDEVARLLGVSSGRVLVQPTWVGGAFGRRVASDFVVEAVEASRRLGRPVQVFWSREDDFAHDHFRPCSLHRLAARLDADGLPAAWHHRIATPSILAQGGAFNAPIDPVAVEGADELPYGIADVEVELAIARAPFRLGFWRSVGHSFNAFAVETFIDELAHAGGRDPVALRRALLQRAGATTHLAVLDLALARAPDLSPGDGRGRGVAVHASFGSVVAMVADVRVAAGAIHVERVTAAVDCGYAVHPDGVRAQIEGGVVFALSAALHGEVRFAAGRAQASNLHDQPLLRFAAAPHVDVHLVARAAPPERLGGVGEIAVPPLAPAVGNALFTATGRRLRSLPFAFG